MPAASRPDGDRPPKAAVHVANILRRRIITGDRMMLTHVYMISDPYYLSEPLIKTSGFRLTPNGVVDPTTGKVTPFITGLPTGDHTVRVRR